MYCSWTLLGLSYGRGGEVKHPQFRGRNLQVFLGGQCVKIPMEDDEDFGDAIVKAMRKHCRECKPWDDIKGVCSPKRSYATFAQEIEHYESIDHPGVDADTAKRLVERIKRVDRMLNRCKGPAVFYMSGSLARDIQVKINKHNAFLGLK